MLLKGKRGGEIFLTQREPMFPKFNLPLIYSLNKFVFVAVFTQITMYFNITAVYFQLNVT
jgi:hypothetical protein